MDLTRREFLKVAGASAAAGVVFAGCNLPEQELIVQSSVLMPQDTTASFENWYATLCRQCNSVEGIVVRVVEGRAKKIEGNQDYPINTGKTMAACQAGVQALYHPDRVHGPKRLRQGATRGSGDFEDVSWDEARRTLAERLQALGDRSSLLLITDPLRGHEGLVAKRFAEGFGGRNLNLEPFDTIALHAAIKQVFDQDQVPDFDIAHTDYLLSFGADFLSTWLSPVRYARGYGEFRQGEFRQGGLQKRGTFVQVDSRFSATAANADEWVPVTPGSEGLLALSIAQVIVSEGKGDATATQALTGGRGPAALAAFAPQNVAGRIGIEASRIVEIARAFAEHAPRSLAIGGGSAGAHTNGYFNLVAIYSLNYLVGNVGQAGGVLLNPTPPLPELAGLGRGATFPQWQTTVQEMNEGRVQLLLVHGADPAYSLVNLRFGEAAAKVPFVVSFSSMMDDTARMADLILPDRSPLESWGSDVPDPGPGYQVLGLQQPVVNPLKDAEGKVVFNASSFGDELLMAGKAVGVTLPWSTLHEALQEGARKLYTLARGSVKAATFEAFWTGLLARGGWWDVDSRVKTSPPPPKPFPITEAPAEPQGPTGDDTYGLAVFSSNAMGDGHGAALPWLQAAPDPVSTAVWSTWVEINAKVASEKGIREGDVLRLESPQGSVELPVYLNPAAPPGVVGVPTGQGHADYGQWARERGENVLKVLAPVADKQTGAFAWAATRVRLSRTGRRVRLPKLEGSTLPLQPEDVEIIKVVPPA